MTPFPASALQLLVVDDDRQILDLLELSLSLQGFSVTTAISGNEALKLARQRQPFDVIVMDVLMAPLDGFETVKCLHDILGEALPPVVYLSGLNREEDVPHFPGHRCAFLVKPFRPAQLVALIREQAAPES
ncbi:response regulator [Deinococcus fonticola]|uniref:response regulator n=1 Tax=Deinococcus fonticola TaxID=2528713 RepID=UPI001F0EC21D|nr:response regulator [Deinococcus fonticola]